MVEEPHLEELSQAVSDGFLAEDVVYATSRLLRHEELDDNDQRALEQGRLLLDFLVKPAPGKPRVGGLLHLASDESALDALRAVRVEAPGEDVQAFLRRVSDSLQQAVNSGSVVGHEDDVETVRRIFRGLGQFTLARATTLSRSPEDRLTWLTPSPTSSSSQPQHGALSSSS